MTAYNVIYALSNYKILTTFWNVIYILSKNMYELLGANSEMHVTGVTDSAFFSL